jgi:hypothetical protein
MSLNTRPICAHYGNHFLFASALGAAALNPAFQCSYLRTKSPDLLNYVVQLLTGWELASER